MSSSTSAALPSSGQPALLNTELRAQARRQREARRESIVKKKASKKPSSGSNSEWSFVGGTNSSATSSGGGARSGAHASSCSINSTLGITSSHSAAGVNTAPPSVLTIAGQECKEQAAPSHNQRHRAPAYSVSNMSTSSAHSNVAADRRISPQLRKQQTLESLPNTARWSGSSAASNPPATAQRRPMLELSQNRRISVSSTTSEAPAPSSREHANRNSLSIKRPGSVPLQSVAMQTNETDTATEPPRSAPLVPSSSLPSDALCSQTHHAASKADTISQEAGTGILSPTLDNIVSRLESPPKLEGNKDDTQLALMKYCYYLVEKCRSWQRYASAMKVKADTLEVETRFTRAALEQRDAEVRSLEMQNEALRRATTVLESELRRHGSAFSAGEAQALSSATLKSSGHGEGNGMPAIPSPPNSAYAAFQTVDSGVFSANFHRQPLSARQSDVAFPPHSSFPLGMSETHNEVRAPTPLLEAFPTATLSRGQSASSFSSQNQQENVPLPNTQRHLSSHGAAWKTSSELSGQQHVLQSSHSFPPSEAVPSKTLTVAALAAMNRQSEQSVAFPTSVSDQQFAQSGLAAPSPIESSHPQQQSENRIDGHVLSNMPNKSGSTERKSDAENAWHNAASGTDRRRISLSMVEAQAMASANTSQSGVSGLSLPWDASDASRRSRCGSGQSDALTVTEDYLQAAAQQQKRRLRKISQSQQQQFQYLQARMQQSSSLSHHSHGSSDDQQRPPSRPTSRLSNHGRLRTRSRANSISVHDSIPVDKDDVFSAVTVRKPLGSIDANVTRRGSSSAFDSDSHANEKRGIAQEHRGSQPRQEDRTIIDKQSPLQQISPSQNETSPDNDNENDPKGAHRRLYLRLRKELSTPDIVRFERYVHRYDALDIGIEGSRGIVNRVRRLLLPEEIVQAKSTQPDKYRFRKELAREFERIVREDAVPIENGQRVGSCNTSQLNHSGSESTFDESAREAPSASAMNS